jgi:hypothetical protein
VRKPNRKGGMMLRKQVRAAAMVVLMAFAAYGQDLSSMKGYELYSWRVKGRWHYSVIPGTNRSKDYGEITGPQSERIGIAALKAALKKLPKGETVFWMSAAHPGIEKPIHKNAPILELPSRQRIERIKDYCAKLGIKLTLR